MGKAESLGIESEGSILRSGSILPSIFDRRRLLSSQTLAHVPFDESADKRTIVPIGTFLDRGPALTTRPAPLPLSFPADGWPNIQRACFCSTRRIPSESSAEASPGARGLTLSSSP